MRCSGDLREALLPLGWTSNRDPLRRPPLPHLLERLPVQRRCPPQKSMHKAGHDWRRYDKAFRMARAKKLERNPNSKTVVPWSKTDLQLYFTCIPLMTLASAPEQKAGQGKDNAWESQTKSQSRSKQDPDLRKGTCWKFQQGGCTGNCNYPGTHNCYKCGQGHPTSKCPNSVVSDSSVTVSSQV